MLKNNSKIELHRLTIFCSISTAVMRHNPDYGAKLQFRLRHPNYGQNCNRRRSKLLRGDVSKSRTFWSSRSTRKTENWICKLDSKKHICAFEVVYFLTITKHHYQLPTSFTPSSQSIDYIYSCFYC
jgi:hypothetical protein